MGPDKAKYMTEANFAVLFEIELEGWYTDESKWPQNRTVEMLRDWFNIEYHSVATDVLLETNQKEIDWDWFVCIEEMRSCIVFEVFASHHLFKSPHATLYPIFYYWFKSPIGCYFTTAKILCFLSFPQFNCRRLRRRWARKVWVQALYFRICISSMHQIRSVTERVDKSPNAILDPHFSVGACHSAVRSAVSHRYQQLSKILRIDLFQLQDLEYWWFILNYGLKA